MTPSRRARARFLIFFLLLLVAVQVALLVPVIDERVIKPFTAGIASVSGVILNTLGQTVTVDRTVIAGTCFAVDLKNGCNAVEATAFLLAGVVAFPAAMKSKAIGLLAGAALLQMVNLIRVNSLYLLGCYRRDWFDAFHLAIWQSVIFAIAIGFFVVWTRRVSGPRHAA
ncbi:MAG: exosortase H [Thermoanaerobaculia bacterium]|nr:exosortase H [Thermoanaerobaculia bacterium]